MDDARVSEVSRRLRSRCDAVLAAVWFMPPPEPGFSSLAARAACMGAIRGEAAAALFVPLEPGGVARAVDDGFAHSTPDALLAARLRGAVDYLGGVLGPEPDGLTRAVELLRPVATAGTADGHPVYAGLLALGWTGSPLGDLWRASDLVRERRGDSHRNAWIATGLDAVELCVLTDLWRPRAIGSGTSTWPDDAVATAKQRLVDRGLVVDDQLTGTGRALRDEIELATDRQERAAAEALGDDVDELFALMAPWATAMIESFPGAFT